MSQVGAFSHSLVQSLRYETWPRQRHRGSGAPGAHVSPQPSTAFVAGNVTQFAAE